MMKLLQATEHTVMIRGEPITWMDEGNGETRRVFSGFAHFISTYCGHIVYHICLEVARGRNSKQVPAFDKL